MIPKYRFIRWLTDLSRRDGALAGGKGANLGEMHKAGVPVPMGFVVITDAYEEFLRESGLAAPIRDLLAGGDPFHLATPEHVAGEIAGLIAQVPAPDAVARAVRDACRELGSPPVAVRSSGTVEDLVGASSAGQQDTFLNVRGNEAVLNAVKECWASLFSPRALAYRSRRGPRYPHPAMAVVVQRMVRSDVSGVVFTADPVSGDRGVLLVEAAFGLGEAVVSGAITPDLYRVDRQRLALASKTVHVQAWKLTDVPADSMQGGCMELALTSEEGGRQKLGDREILDLAALALKIEARFGIPQDIEWAREAGVTQILQSRPVTAV